jgi:hypothetical protein
MAIGSEDGSASRDVTHVFYTPQPDEIVWAVRPRGRTSIC